MNAVEAGESGEVQRPGQLQRQPADGDIRPAGLPGPQEPEAWQRALDAAGSLSAAAGALRTDKEKTLALLADALRDFRKREEALLLLSYLDTSYTVALADALVGWAISPRYALLIRRLFGRLRHDQIADVVPAAVLRQLDETDDDDDAYRRMAELLRHLGLISALKLISDRALASDNTYVREVGAEFAPDSG